MDNFENNGLNGFDSATPMGDNPEEQEDKKIQKAEETTDFVLVNKSDDTAKETEQKEANPFFPSGKYSEQTPTPTPPIYDPKVSAAKNPPQKKPPKKEKQGGFSLGALIAVALITAVITSGCFYILSRMNNDAAPQNITSQNNKTTEKVVEINGSIEQLAEAAAEAAMDSVVGVQTTFAVQNFFSGQSTTSGSGSGVIYKENGYIITNYHVIADALESTNSSISVFLNNDTEKGYEAEVINYNISCDLAVLKINKTGLNAIKIAKTEDLKVGQYVVAIGSPAGLEFMGSTTFGIISGLNRQIATTDGNMSLIQTDAAINPGNSGGALVNTKGELIGINSSKLVSTGYEGMGFAIPVNTVVEICDKLIAHEGEGEAYTGIAVSYNYTSRVLQFYGYPTGAVVAEVDEGSPAEAAGIKRGDIITKFGNTEITEYTQYESALKSHYKGEKVAVEYYRSGKTYTTTVTIGATN